MQLWTSMLSVQQSQHKASRSVAHTRTVKKVSFMCQGGQANLDTQFQTIDVQT
jgi:hypothetical protein